VSLANFTPGAAAKVWRYSAAQLGAIWRSPISRPRRRLQRGVPGEFHHPAGDSAGDAAGTAPVIAAVTNAASYDARSLPGRWCVWGPPGPDTAALLGLDSNGLVSTSTGGFGFCLTGFRADGVCASHPVFAVVPYFGAIKATTHVQLEYQGVRSLPVEFPSGDRPGCSPWISAARGRGDSEPGRVTRNSAAAPAHPGTVWFCGHRRGITDPAGVDGRRRWMCGPSRWPRYRCRSADCRGGGVCGRAPGAIPGLFQINARISPNVTPGTACLCACR